MIMLFDEKQMLEICKKYGIETIEKEGYPLYQGKEMDENFSISEIMHEPIRVKYNTWDKVLAYLKYLKRKLKLKGEMYGIGSKILFLQLKRCLCQLDMKVIDCKKWIYEKVYGK